MDCEREGEWECDVVGSDSQVDDLPVLGTIQIDVLSDGCLNNTD